MPANNKRKRRKVARRYALARTASDDEAVVAKILDRITKEVKFTYPGKEPRKTGTLKDRAVIPSPGVTGVPYWDVVDLIEFPDEPQREWIRIGYYRKPKDRLVWASQTTITEPVETWKELLVHAAKEKGWFRKLLEEVLERVKTETAHQSLRAARVT
jgi:hypothetical protein